MTGELASAAMNLALLGVRLYAALLLIGAAIAKLRDPADASRAVGAYQVLPSVLVGPSAAALPLVELGVGFCVALVPHPAASVCASTLFGIFAAAIGVNLMRGRRSLECGCAFRARKIGPELVVHNLILAALLLAGVRHEVTVTPLGVLLALIWASAMLALLLSLDTLHSIETPAKRQKAR